MTVRVDWTTVDQPQVRLSLVATPTGWYSVLDQHGHPYLPITQDIGLCLRFMSAMASKKHALIDDVSVERATWQSSGGGDPQSSVAAHVEDPSSYRLGPVPHAGSSSSPEYSIRVPTNVIPFPRKEIA